MKINSATVQDKPAGEYSEWLNETINIIKTKGESDVACEECSACCNSSYFVHITPNDKDAIKHIPKELTFIAPGMPKGHLLLGYDSKGHCPMFTNNKCSIYEFRPQTCRQYDCRVFPATGIKNSEKGKEVIAKQSERWKFDFKNKKDKEAFEAVQASAKFIRKNASHFPSGFLPSNATQQAVLAIAVSEIFINKSIPKNATIPETVKLLVESVT